MIKPHRIARNAALSYETLVVIRAHARQRGDEYLSGKLEPIKSRVPLGI